MVAMTWTETREWQLVCSVVREHAKMPGELPLAYIARIATEAALIKPIPGQPMFRGLDMPRPRESDYRLPYKED
jgi:hypothetical protein